MKAVNLVPQGHLVQQDPQDHVAQAAHEAMQVHQELPVTEEKQGCRDREVNRALLDLQDQPAHKDQLDRKDQQAKQDLLVSVMA